MPGPTLQTKGSSLAVSVRRMALQRVRDSGKKRVAFESARIVHGIGPGAVYGDDEMLFNIHVDLLAEDAECAKEATASRSRCERPPLIAVSKRLIARKLAGFEPRSRYDRCRYLHPVDGQDVLQFE